MGTVVLVRHGETTWNRDRRLQGWAPTELTERGVEQAASVGAAIAEGYTVDRIVASDLRRTRETVDRMTDDLDATPRFDADWRERDFGAGQGLLYEDFRKRFPELSVEASGSDALEVRPDSGESLRDLQSRVVGAWERLRGDLGDGETALVVTHGGPIDVVVGRLKGLDLAESVRDLDQDNCAINEVRIEGEEATIVRENEAVQSPPVG